ncbi:hypothetical protein [Telluribacter sp.]|jgi:hypothetical protein|uniref:hypothetical protein n=1 Tax=Telluribacter sp. TaxID=1978767 RepID=UPI002E14D169|nr:hypothetical protein [Telluribacter sp.]
MNIVYTVCNRSELPQAIALSTSVKKQHPEAQMIIGWVDEAPVPALPEGIVRLSVKLINIPDWPAMYERYYDFELVAACRPWFARYLVSQYPDCTTLTFLSPSTYLYQPLPLGEYPEAELLLTAHLTQPLPAVQGIDDKRILNIGMYHSNAWVLRPTVATKSFLSWWANRTLDRAAFDLCHGMCLDQLWLNYAPLLVPNTKIISQPGWHMGLHSMAFGALREVNGGFKSGEYSLLSFDFAGLGSFHPIWSDHQQLVINNQLFGRLYQNYKTELEKWKLYKIGGQASFGKIPVRKKYRSLRKGIVTNLKKVLTHIDQFELNQTN